MSTTYPPRPTISVAVSGPSPHLAMLRALLAKARDGLTVAGVAVRRGLRMAWHLPRAIADATLAILATDRGYTTVTGLLGTGVRTVGRLLSRGLRWLGRGSASGARKVGDLVGLVSPATGRALARGITMAQDKATAAFDLLEHTVQQVTELIRLLTSSPLVRGVTTRLAAACSGLLAVHVISQGALATRLVQAIPGTVQLVAWATNPWMLLAGLGVAYLAAVAFTGIRLWQAGGPRPVGPDGQEPTSDQCDAAFEAIVSRLRVVITPDGSVRVDGVPADLPEHEQRDLATAAARAAVSHLEQVARRGHPLSSAQRRAATRAAKTAARDWLTDMHLATA